MNEMVMFQCKICHAIFSIDMETLRQMETKQRYLSCPFGHRDIKRTEDIEKIMTERRAVEL